MRTKISKPILGIAMGTAIAFGTIGNIAKPYISPTQDVTAKTQKSIKSEVSFGLTIGALFMDSGSARDAAVAGAVTTAYAGLMHSGIALAVPNPVSGAIAFGYGL